MIENKVIWFAKPKNSIRTKHVFIEEGQVFMKRDAKESALQNNREVGYPISCQWIPVMALERNLNH